MDLEVDREVQEGQEGLEALEVLEVLEVQEVQEVLEGPWCLGTTWIAVVQFLCQTCQLSLHQPLLSLEESWSPLSLTG